MRAGTHLVGPQEFLELALQPFDHEHEPDDQNDGADDADRPPTAAVAHDLRRVVLLLLGLAALGALDDPDRHDGEEGVDHASGERLDARAGARSFASNAERSLAQPPQRVRGETGRDEPQAAANRAACSRGSGARPAGRPPGSTCPWPASAPPTRSAGRSRRAPRARRGPARGTPCRSPACLTVCRVALMVVMPQPVPRKAGLRTAWDLADARRQRRAASSPARSAVVLSTGSQ